MFAMLLDCLRCMSSGEVWHSIEVSGREHLSPAELRSMMLPQAPDTVSRAYVSLNQFGTTFPGSDLGS